MSSQFWQFRDVLEAVAKLKAENLLINVQTAGKGDIDFLPSKAKQLGIEKCVRFLGLIPNSRIIHLMREADIVTIPSHHGYAEGLPMAIYEALYSRTPIIASDYPMFREKLKDEVSAIVFSAGNSSKLANSIKKLISSSDLDGQISNNSKVAWEKLQIPVKLRDFYEHWLFDPPTESHWLYQYRLSSGYYNNLD